eukprot:3565778-Rhodomonas_salina.1
MPPKMPRKQPTIVENARAFRALGEWRHVALANWPKHCKALPPEENPKTIISGPYPSTRVPRRHTHGVHEAFPSAGTPKFWEVRLLALGIPNANLTPLRQGVKVKK